jgi:regulator of cell morphogenesis and NO signaling
MSCSGAVAVRIVLCMMNTIADLVLSLPNSIPVLERLGIDYCCHGGRSIQQACSGASITAEQLLTMINEAPAAAPERSFADEAIPEIIDFILQTHHAYTRAALETLEPLAAKVAAVHGANHPELIELKELVNALCADLIPHMMKEEQVLFPFLLCETEACFGSVANPIRMMMLEHEAAGELLAQIRRTANDFALPPEACRSYIAYFQLLEELELDLHRHIHVENNVLFPKALNEFAHI